MRADLKEKLKTSSQNLKLEARFLAGELPESHAEQYFNKPFAGWWNTYLSEKYESQLA